MNYFEFSEPYYALIQAVSVDAAKAVYLKMVTDEIEAEPLEINRDRALILFSRGIIESGETLSADELLAEFTDENNQLLLVDGSLI